MNEYVIGLDLGQAQDYTALAILQALTEPAPMPWEDGYQTAQAPKPAYHVGWLERYPLGTPYPEIVRAVCALTDRAPLRHAGYRLVIDATGVGRPVFDLFKEAGLPVVGVLITGGDAVTRDGDIVRVPKRNLAANLQVLVQNHRLTVSQDLALGSILAREMLNFKVKIDLKGHDSYENWRDSIHDDLTLAAAVAAWYAEAAAYKDTEAVLAAFRWHD